MLIRQSILQRIKAGEVTLAFRRWRRPTVKTGGTLRTAVGVLAIQSVEQTSTRHIKEADARQAGYADKDALVKELGRRQGDVYRIVLAYAGEDARLRLREDIELTEDEFSEISAQLHSWDAASRAGKWTLCLLTAISESPRQPAAKLALETGFEQTWLKTNVRKLKNLGLTISHHPGYTLSPRGEVVLQRLKDVA